MTRKEWSSVSVASGLRNDLDYGKTCRIAFMWCCDEKCESFTLQIS